MCVINSSDHRDVFLFFSLFIYIHLQLRIIFIVFLLYYTKATPLRLVFRFCWCKLTRQFGINKNAKKLVLLQKKYYQFDCEHIYIQETPENYVNYRCLFIVISDIIHGLVQLHGREAYRFCIPAAHSYGFFKQKDARKLKCFQIIRWLNLLLFGFLKNFLLKMCSLQI